MYVVMVLCSAHEPCFRSAFCWPERSSYVRDEAGRLDANDECPHVRLNANRVAHQIADIVAAMRNVLW